MTTKEVYKIKIYKPFTSVVFFITLLYHLHRFLFLITTISRKLGSFYVIDQLEVKVGQ